MNLEKINPKFLRWFTEQAPEIVADVEAKWDETATHDDLHPELSIYARQYRTLIYCRDKHGYDFP